MIIWYDDMLICYKKVCEMIIYTHHKKYVWDDDMIYKMIITIY